MGTGGRDTRSSEELLVPQAESVEQAAGVSNTISTKYYYDLRVFLLSGQRSIGRHSCPMSSHETPLGG